MDEVFVSEEHAQEIIKTVLSRGGEKLDIELAEIIQQLYDLSKKHKIEKIYY